MSPISTVLVLLIVACFSKTAECLDPHSTYAQYLSQRWTMSNGFPGGRINAITQTPDGYLWVGTSKGLVRFDGVTFIPVGGPNGIAAPISQALSLVSSKDGALWVWDQDMNLRRYKQGKLGDAEFLAGQEDRVVSAVTSSRDGDVLIATQAPRLFRLGNGRVQTLTNGGSLGIPSPQTIAQTTDGKIWMATYEAGLFYWDHDRIEALKDLKPDKINCLLPVKGKGLWIGTDEGAVLWDGRQISLTISSQALKGARVLSLANDRGGNIWIGTSKGLFRQNSEGLRMMESAAEESPRTLTAIFEDREGNLWTGDDQGLEQLRDGTFTSFTVPRGSALEGSGGGPIYADSLGGTWFAGSHGGLYEVVNGTATKVAAASLGRDVIYSITGFKDDLWVGRRDGGLTHLVQEGTTTPSVRTIRTYTRSQGLPQNSVSSVFRSFDGTIWAGTLSGGVSSLRHDRFSTLTSADGLGSNTISSIQEDKSGAIWFGTSDGLSRFVNGEAKTFRARDGLPSDEITTLLMDSSGVLWVGTSQGLARWSHGQIHPITDARPALHESVFGIAEDREGSLWLTTSNHILRVSRDALLKGSISSTDYREFSESDGLRSSEGTRRDRSAITDPGGHVWLSTSQGLSLIRALPGPTAPAPPHVDSVQSDEAQLDPYQALRIGPEPHRITITFAAVSLAMPNSVRYRYKLQGFDHVWSEPSEARQVVYTNLGPGSYEFGLQASQGDDHWTGSDSLLSFSVQPTLWQTGWFRWLWVCALCGLLFAVYRARVRFLARAMNVRFNERLEERTRMARELHDTFLQTVQGSKLVADDALSLGADEVRMRNALERVSGWLGQAVGEGRAALHALRVSTTEENELAGFLERTLNEQCHHSLLSGTLSVIGDPRALHPIVRDEITLIAKEAIRNACLHSQGTQLRVKLCYAANLSVCFRDNGVGMSASVLEAGKEGHFGLTGMKERCARIAAKMSISSSQDRGTEVLLSVPGQVAYRRERHSWPSRFSKTDTES